MVALALSPVPSTWITSPMPNLSCRIFWPTDTLWVVPVVGLTKVLDTFFSLLIGCSTGVLVSFAPNRSDDLSK